MESSRSSGLWGFEIMINLRLIIKVSFWLYFYHYFSSVIQESLCKKGTNVDYRQRTLRQSNVVKNGETLLNPWSYNPNRFLS